MKLWLAVACILTLPAFGQETGIVDGRVTNSQTGEGVAGATVRLSPMGGVGSVGVRQQSAPAGPVSAQSGPDGSFQFPSVPPGFYNVSAQCTGYTLVRFSSAQSFPVTAGQQVSGVAIQLDPDGRLTGKVADEDGNPVAGADVEAFSIFRLRGRAQMRRESAAKTDAGGVFTLKQVVAGKYYLAATPQSQKTLDATAETPQNPEKFDLVRTYFPRAADAAGATVVEVTPGSSVADLTIHMLRAATYHVRGHVEGLALTGKGKGPQLSLSVREGVEASVPMRSVSVSPDANFDIPDVQTGTYSLRLTGNANATMTGPAGGSRTQPNRVLASSEVQVGTADVNGVVLAILTPAVLLGEVTMENGNGAAFNLSQVQVNVTPVDGESGWFRHTPGAVNPDGSFTVGSLDPGRYYVHVGNPPRGAYVKAILFNRQELADGLLDLTLGGSGTLQVVLRQGVAEVDGMLNADSSTQTAANGTIVLVPENLPADGIGLIFSSAVPGKSFVIQNVPPGKYHAFAVTSWDAKLWQDPDFLKAMAAEGVTLEVEESGHAQIQLTVTTPDQLMQIAARYGFTASP